MRGDRVDYSYLDSLALLGVGGAHPGGLALSKHLLSNESIQRDSRVLDAGCGTGQTSAYLATTYSCEVIALDIDEIMLTKARKRLSQLNVPVQVIQGNTESLPLADASIDFIISESVLAFTNLSKSIAEYQRVLKPRGIVIALEMGLAQTLPDHEKENIEAFYGIAPLQNREGWIRLLAEKGFTEINVEQYTMGSSSYDLNHAADFILSEQLDTSVFEIMEAHRQLSEHYKDDLVLYVMRCSF